MRVLNNNNGALTYNRCTACDISELKCKVGLRLPANRCSGANAAQLAIRQTLTHTSLMPAA